MTGLQAGGQARSGFVIERARKLLVVVVNRLM